jgi:hypothetical protein
MEQNTSPGKFRLVMESIFIQIARDAVEEAEQHEIEFKKSGSYSAELKMQRQAIVAVVILVQALEGFINVHHHQ